MPTFWNNFAWRNYQTTSNCLIRKDNNCLNAMNYEFSPFGWDEERGKNFYFLYHTNIYRFRILS